MMMVILSSNYLTTVCGHWRRISIWIIYFDLTCICLPILKDEVVADVEARLAAWTFLPEGNFNSFCVDFDSTDCKLLKSDSFTWFHLFIRKRGIHSDTALWEWAEIWTTFRLLSWQGESRVGWPPCCHCTYVLVWCGKGWRNSLP